MYPIFEQGNGKGIGYLFDKFLQRFISICESHLQDKKATAFAFILYDPRNKEIKTILKDLGGFAKLDRLSGHNLSIFYIRSINSKVIRDFNEIFLGAFNLHGNARLPCVVFFNLIDGDVTNVEIIELEQSNMMFAFNELYETIDNYIKYTINRTVVREEPKRNRLLFQSLKKYALSPLIDLFLGKAYERGYEQLTRLF